MPSAFFLAWQFTQTNDEAALYSKLGILRRITGLMYLLKVVMLR
jgi:hypothetical protein